VRVGAILSVFLAVGYVQLAWTGGDYEFMTLETLRGTLGRLLVGILVIPRTIGVLLVPVPLISPVASGIALIRHGFGHAARVAGVA